MSKTYTTEAPTNKGGATFTMVSATGNVTGDTFTLESRHVTFNITSAAATTVIEAGHDGTTFPATLRTSGNTTESVSISEWYPYVRAVVSNYASGTITVTAAEFYGK